MVRESGPIFLGVLLRGDARWCGMVRLLQTRLEGRGSQGWKRQKMAHALKTHEEGDERAGRGKVVLGPGGGRVLHLMGFGYTSTPFMAK